MVLASIAQALPLEQVVYISVVQALQPKVLVGNSFALPAIHALQLGEVLPKSVPLEPIAPQEQYHAYHALQANIILHKVPQFVLDSVPREPTLRLLVHPPSQAVLELHALLAHTAPPVHPLLYSALQVHLIVLQVQEVAQGYALLECTELCLAQPPPQIVPELRALLAPTALAAHRLPCNALLELSRRHLPQAAHIALEDSGAMQHLQGVSHVRQGPTALDPPVVQEVYTSAVQAPYILVQQLPPASCVPQAIPALQAVEAASRSAPLEHIAPQGHSLAPHAVLEHIAPPAPVPAHPVPSAPLITQPAYPIAYTAQLALRQHLPARHRALHALWVLIAPDLPPALVVSQAP